MATRSHDAVVRAAEAALRSNGGRAVLLRMPAPAASGADAEQLGLATPQFQDLPLYPAAFRKNLSISKLLVSASAVTSLIGSRAFNSAEVLFETAAGVVVDDVLYAITGSVTYQAEGQPYCYCLALCAPVR
jgi:hypothetical protein